jgi:hypothetical protein
MNCLSAPGLALDKKLTVVALAATELVEGWASPLFFFKPEKRPMLAATCCVCRLPQLSDVAVGTLAGWPPVAAANDLIPLDRVTDEPVPAPAAFLDHKCIKAGATSRWCCKA